MIRAQLVEWLRANVADVKLIEESPTAPEAAKEHAATTAQNLAACAQLLELDGELIGHLVDPTMTSRSPGIVPERTSLLIPTDVWNAILQAARA